MDKLFDRIKREWNDDPLKVVIIGTVVVGTATKLIDVMSAAQGRRAYAKQVDYRVNRRK